MTTANRSPETTAPPAVAAPLTITRFLDAPREQVFAAWTDPAQMAQWWSPHGFTTPRVELDVRPGGALRIDMRGPDGNIYPDNGVFHEIVPPERIVFTLQASADAAGPPLLEVRFAVTFKDVGGKTKLTLHAVVLKMQPAAQGMLAGMAAGWDQSLQKLGEYIATGAVTPQPPGFGTTITTPSEREIVMTRLFAAPRPLVWRALTDPALIPQWWGPRRLATIVDQLDLRPGGTWRFLNREPDGTEYGFHGEFREVTPPARLVQTFEWEGLPGHVSVDTYTLDEQDGQTRVTAHTLFATAEDRDGMFQSGMERGARETWDRLAELLARSS